MKKFLLVGSIFFFTFFLFSSLLFSGEKKYTFDFVRQVKKQDRFQIFIKLDRESQYTLSLAGSEKKLEKRESMKLDLAGSLTVEKISTDGKNKLFLLQIDSFSGQINSSATLPDACNGRRFLIDTKYFPAKITANDGKKELDKTSLILLQSIFSSSQENMLSSLTGKRATLKRGEKFSVNTESYRKELAARKIFCKEKDFPAFCRFDGIFPYRENRCGRFYFNIKSDTVPGYQFRCQMTVYLPEKKEDGPPVSIQRDAVEFLAKNIPPVNHLASGGMMQMETKETSSFVLLPARKERVPAISGGFLDLLKRK